MSPFFLVPLALCASVVCLSSATAGPYKEHEFKTMAQCEQMQRSYKPESGKEARYQLCFSTMNGVLHRSPEGKRVICHVRNLKELDYAYQCQTLPMPADLQAWQREIVEQAKPLQMRDSYDDVRRDWTGYGVALSNEMQMRVWADLAGRAASCGEEILDFAHRVDTAIDRSIGGGPAAIDKRGLFRSHLLVALYRYLPDPREKSEALIAQIERELHYARYNLPSGALAGAQGEHTYFTKEVALRAFDNERDCPAVRALFAETAKRLPEPFVITEPPYSSAQLQRYIDELMPAVLCSIDITDAKYRIRRWIMQTPPSRQLTHLYALEDLGILNAEAEAKVKLPRDCQTAALEFLKIKFPDGPGAQAWLQRYPAPWGPGRQRRADYFAEIDRIDRWAKSAARGLWCDQDAQVREFVIAAQHWIDRRVWQNEGKQRIARRFRQSMDWAFADVAPGGWRNYAGDIYEVPEHVIKAHAAKFEPLGGVGPLSERFRESYRKRSGFGGKSRAELTHDPLQLERDCPGVAKELAAALKEVNTPTEPPEPVFAQRITYTRTAQVCRPPKADECLYNIKRRRVECKPPKERKYYDYGRIDTREISIDARYEDNGDGTLSRFGKRTLMWKKCPEGLSGPQCKSGKPLLFNREQAEAYAKAHSFAGHKDWIVPDLWELAQLFDYDCYNPSIDAKLFPNTPPALFLAARWNFRTTPTIEHWGHLDFYGGAGYGSGLDPEEVYHLRLVRRVMNR